MLLDKVTLVFSVVMKQHYKMLCALSCVLDFCMSHRCWEGLKILRKDRPRISPDRSWLLLGDCLSCGSRGGTQPTLLQNSCLLRVVHTQNCSKWIFSNFNFFSVTVLFSHPLLGFPLLLFALPQWFRKFDRWVYSIAKIYKHSAPPFYPLSHEKKYSGCFRLCPCYEPAGE